MSGNLKELERLVVRGDHLRIIELADHPFTFSPNNEECDACKLISLLLDNASNLLACVHAAKEVMRAARADIPGGPSLYDLGRVVDQIKDCENDPPRHG